MTNMFSMGSMMGGIGSSGNIHQSLKSKYAVGYPDIGTTPCAHAYSMPVRPSRSDSELPRNFWQRIFKSYYL